MSFFNTFLRFIKAPLFAELTAIINRNVPDPTLAAVLISEVAKLTGVPVPPAQ